jgi:hypothetical protein
MITTAARPPNINAQSIAHQGLDLLGFRQGAAPLDAFGVSIGSEMTVVPGRILPPPGIKYNGSAPEVDERASWNLRGVRFAKGAKLADWAVLLIKDNGRDEFSGRSDPELLRTIRGFADMCGKSGMTVDRRDPVIVEAVVPPKNFADPTRHAAIGVIEATLKTVKKKPSIALVILSNGDKHIYSGLKHLCDSRLDLGKLYASCPYASVSMYALSPSNRVRPFKQNSKG